jgi:hypothetical protein
VKYEQKAPVDEELGVQEEKEQLGRKLKRHHNKEFWINCLLSDTNLRFVYLRNVIDLVVS